MNQSTPQTETASPDEYQCPESGGSPQPIPERVIPPLHSQVVLRGAPNHRAKEMEICEPWNFQPAIPTQLLSDKESFTKWLQETTTKHLVYTTAEGTSQGTRVSKNNPLRKLHGLTAEFDANSGDARVDSRIAEMDLQPNWVSRSRFSGGVRLLWLFEEPLTLTDKGLEKTFLQVAGKELQLAKLLPGWDEDAWLDSARRYEVGTDWKQVLQTPLTADQIHNLLFKAAQKVKRLGELEDVAIPMEHLEEEALEKFPGTISPGDFKVGNRVPVFWDGGGNPTSCIIKENGCVCFSRTKSLYSWREIFGRAFVEQYEADRKGKAAREVWFDGRNYWLKVGGCWMPHSKEDYKLRLWDRGFESKEDQNGMLLYVQDRRRVAGIAPSIYNPEDTFTVNGRLLLNISTAKVVEPHEKTQTWCENFPWLGEFLTTCWSEDDQEKQKEIFFAWLRRFYRNGLSNNPEQGHALFLVGKTGRGKTLLATRIIGDTMGGSCDATDVLLGGSTFNKEPAETGVWNIDDGELGKDQKKRDKFSEAVKRMVANPTVAYQPKFHDQQTIPWFGRPVITLNTNDASLEMIPDIDSGNEDKFIVLRFSDKPRTFEDRWKNEARIKAELPYFLRWLIDTETPAELLGSSRFGVVPYIHESTKKRALYSGKVGELLEIIDTWRVRQPNTTIDEGIAKIHACENGKIDIIVTASRFYSFLARDEITRALVAKMTPRSLGMRLRQAAEIKESGVTIQRSDEDGNHREGNLYRIIGG